MTADVVLPRVGHGLVRGADVPGHVLAEVEVVDGHPAGVDDVDEHERVVVREMDVDVVRRVVGPVVGQLDPFAADLELVAVLEGDLRGGAGSGWFPPTPAPRVLRSPSAQVRPS